MIFTCPKDCAASSALRDHGLVGVDERWLEIVRNGIVVEATESNGAAWDSPTASSRRKQGRCSCGAAMARQELVYPDTLFEALLPPADGCLEALLARNLAELLTLR